MNCRSVVQSRWAAGRRWAVLWDGLRNIALDGLAPLTHGTGTQTTPLLETSWTTRTSSGAFTAGIMRFEFVMWNALWTGFVFAVSSLSLWIIKREKITNTRLIKTIRSTRTCRQNWTRSTSVWLTWTESWTVCRRAVLSSWYKTLHFWQIINTTI